MQSLQRWTSRPPSLFCGVSPGNLGNLRGSQLRIYSLVGLLGQFEDNPNLIRAALLYLEACNG